MSEIHQHKVFGQEHSHAVDFRHTSREDQAAHEQEIKMRKALTRKERAASHISEDAPLSLFEDR